MIHFCTVCDNSYFEKGLTLYESIKKHYEETFIFHWLCIDKEIYEKLSVYWGGNIRLYQLKDFEDNDSNLLAAKTIKPKVYGDEYSQYCWCLTPYFVEYLLHSLEENETLVYCDADIFFLDSPVKILDVVGEHSIGLHTHRSTVDEETIVGKYNIGVTVFKNDHNARLISRLWKSWMLDPENQYAEKYGTCGDQKYAELWERIIGEENICVFDNEILHLAPWCTHNPENKQPVFFHFSHFRFTENEWFDSLRGEWNPAKEPGMKQYYEQYYKAIKNVRYNRILED